MANEITMILQLYERILEPYLLSCSSFSTDPSWKIKLAKWFSQRQKDVTWKSTTALLRCSVPYNVRKSSLETFSWYEINVRNGTDIF
jgi:hypothetical protein